MTYKELIERRYGGFISFKEAAKRHRSTALELLLVVDGQVPVFQLDDQGRVHDVVLMVHELMGISERTLTFWISPCVDIPGRQPPLTLIGADSLDEQLLLGLAAHWGKPNPDYVH